MAVGFDRWKWFVGFGAGFLALNAILIYAGFNHSSADGAAKLQAMFLVAGDMAGVRSLAFRAERRQLTESILNDFYTEWILPLKKDATCRVEPARKDSGTSQHLAFITCGRGEKRVADIPVFGYEEGGNPRSPAIVSLLRLYGSLATKEVNGSLAYGLDKTRGWWRERGITTRYDTESKKMVSF